jgi:GTP pyrophosphokinase
MLVKHFGFRSRLDLYSAITHDEINLLELKKFKVDGQRLIPPAVEEPVKLDKPEEQVPTTFRRSSPPKLLLNGESADQYEYQLANCCNPVMGDDVFAFLSSNSGMKIHRTTCPNAINLMANYGYRVMKAEWVQAGTSSFRVDLLVTGIDTGPGVIERLSQRISSTLGLNIRSFYIDGDEGFFEGKISLIVSNKDQIVQAIQALKTLDGISSVTRVESN